MTSNEITISAADIEALGKDLDELRDRIVADLGDRDREYTTRSSRHSAAARSPDGP